MQPVRLACVRYLNTAPLIEGLEKVEGLTLIPAVPAAIAPKVVSGEADMGLCSIVDIVGLPGTPSPGLALIPCGMIGCNGPTLTVRLFSAVPFDQITELHADADSHTSVILAQLLLARRFGVRPAVVNLDTRGGSGGNWPATVLLIGDKVVTDCPPRDRYPHQLDLGEEWKAWTGLPFVYAMWMCRRDEAASPGIHTAAALLDRQRRHNAGRMEWVLGRRIEASGWPLELARTYLGELLRFEVGPREREAVERFLAEAREVGLVARRGVVWGDNQVDAQRNGSI